MKRKRFTEEQIAPHLSVQYANLVLFPEYTAFTCCFSGSKGSIVRQMNNAVAAFAMLGLPEETMAWEGMSSIVGVTL